jgi:parallel beta-helix repeat protein
MHPYGSVLNANTNLTYLTMQSAINAPETSNGHTILVEAGTYNEHITVNKTLSLIGENQTTTIIDGEGTGTVLTINTDNVSVAGFTIRNGGIDYPPYGNDCGVLLDHCVGSNISHNAITNSRIGLYLFYSEDSTIEDNFVYSNHENGIWLYHSGSNILTQNQMIGNRYNFGVFGGDFPDFNNNVDVSNTVDGKPIQYVTNAKDKVFENQADTGVLYLINCVNITVRNLNLTKNGHAMFWYNVTNSIIENVTASNSNYGIYLQNSIGNVVDRNYCADDWVGICLQDSYNTIVENNIAENGEKGISLYGASNNTIEGNTIHGTLFGIRLSTSNLNEISHNNLIDNVEQVNSVTSYQNAWDDGFEGNFWSDHVGVDSNMDGISDKPYIIDDTGNMDHYPLLGCFYNLSPYSEGDLAHVAVITNSTLFRWTLDNSSHLIRLTVNGSDGTFGFCRIHVPHALVEPEISVIIDGGLPEVLYPNYSIRDDGSCRWIYFAYQHSSHEISVLPEFWTPVFLCVLIVTAISCSMMKRTKSQK